MANESTKGNPMATTSVTLRLDRGLKEQADELFSSLGLSFTSAVNIFIKKALRTQSIPFEVSLGEDANDRAIREALEDLLASDRARLRTGSVNEGTPHSYDAITSLDEANQFIDALRRQ